MSLFHTIFDILNEAEALVVLLLWGWYIFVTKSQFKEMQKQTDEVKKQTEEIQKQTELQSQAVLVVSASTEKSTSSPTRAPERSARQRISGLAFSRTCRGPRVPQNGLFLSCQTTGVPVSIHGQFRSR